MDGNKLRVLRDIGYRVGPACGLCEYSDFPNDDWGTCSRHLYDHAKHTGERRHLSIHKCGSCPNFELSEHVKLRLSGFAEFV